MSKSKKPAKNQPSASAIAGGIQLDEGLFGVKIIDRLSKEERNMVLLKREIKEFAEFLEDFVEPLDLEELESKVSSILKTEDIEVNKKNLKTYLNYIKNKISLPCHLTGIEPFAWEEDYFDSPPHIQKKSPKPKATLPSFENVFLLLGFEENVSLEEGIRVQLKRTSDRRKFVLPLVDLEVYGDLDNSYKENHELLNTYEIWFVNY
ncbi:hypothetical protein JJD41_19445 [Oxynema sp. CENA135]|uniref:hypothetical protein n=1 Tax=Oxynema sp. CENA135 TaxID=984206 RepID=UPI00190B1CFB|nr:hypothetical protein [Oxynema sp. CENA135]MBK4732027.1 hypothetical protein [Oxynema sp. CENA135]